MVEKKTYVNKKIKNSHWVLGENAAFVSALRCTCTKKEKKT